MRAGSHRIDAMSQPYEAPTRAIDERAFAVPARGSRIAAAAEGVLVALPVTLMFMVFSPSVLLEPALRSGDAGQAVLGALTLVAYAGLLAGWVLLSSFVVGGIASLRRRHAAWWWTARVGAIVLLLGLAAFLAFDVPFDFRAWWWPGDDFKLFSFGGPLLLPHLHLELERRFRR
jgi:hypothetical protein